MKISTESDGTIPEIQAQPSALSSSKKIGGLTALFAAATLGTLPAATDADK